MSSVQKKSVLFVDDDAILRDTLSDQLELYDEFLILQAESAQVALQILKQQNVDLILLDVGLGDMDGRELCRLIRRQGNQAPIIMLTGADSDADTILGLDAGANDYITKPFKLEVLLARLRVQLRQREQRSESSYIIGPYTFEPAMKKLINNKTKESIRLTEKETAILKLLQRNGKNVVPRETLLTEVWGYQDNMQTHTLETHIYRLRQKIEPVAGDASVLITEMGGYRLV